MKYQKTCAEWTELLAISHPEEELSSSEYTALEKHVGYCAECAAIRQQYRLMTAHLRSLAAVQPLPNATAQHIRLKEEATDESYRESVASPVLSWTKDKKEQLHE